uniref:AlNc14C83G5369 protein n=1 Tax=Albugo laibachii Nc14 TaxID=890382 RepID=F0WFI4_9STRA|nr:AlNc14C83G5369 [Albugo laibachii Nc14]|eukprot:CCA19966.1 AlNc14C83G5369 [Albugo laibachii Nc14]
METKKKDSKERKKEGSSSKAKEAHASAKAKETHAPAVATEAQPLVPTSERVHAMNNNNTVSIADIDAIQLFRQYDRSRNGFLTRRDFLEMLRDYAAPYPNDQSNCNVQNRMENERLPIALTDSVGIPLGFERTDHNSEFEAGQLFERYDRDRTGMMNFAKFHTFFTDFRPQLQRFVQDLQIKTYEQRSGQKARLEDSVHVDNVCSEEKAPIKQKTEKICGDKRAQIQRELWKLHTLCKDELIDRRQHLVDTMEAMRAEISVRHQNRTPTGRSWANHKDLSLPEPAARSKSIHAMSDRQLMQFFLEKEQDVTKMDSLFSTIRNLLHNSSQLTSDEELDEALLQVHELRKKAQHVIMLHYYDGDGISTSRRQFPSELSQAVTYDEREQKLDTQDHIFGGEDPGARAKCHAWETREPKGARIQNSTNGDTIFPMDKGRSNEPFVRVKDQIIYELLQERASLCKEKADLEAQIHELSELSTEEMKKWATLTDNMQAEIEKLRYALQRNTSSLQFP